MQSRMAVGKDKMLLKTSHSFTKGWVVGGWTCAVFRKLAILRILLVTEKKKKGQKGITSVRFRSGSEAILEWILELMGNVKTELIAGMGLVKKGYYTNDTKYHRIMV